MNSIRLSIKPTGSCNQSTQVRAHMDKIVATTIRIVVRKSRYKNLYSRCGGWKLDLNKYSMHLLFNRTMVVFSRVEYKTFLKKRHVLK